MKVTKLAAWAIVLFLAVLGFSLSMPYWYYPDAQVYHLNMNDPEVLAQGEYAAIAGDCVACHTAPGGQKFSGGLAMETPVGVLYSTNITPDKATGIGSYSYQQFEKAVRQGLRPDNAPLYHAMPYPSYQVVSDEDVQAMYAYFMKVVLPVQKENKETTIPWPLNMRWPMHLWQMVFAPKRDFEPAANASAEVNRGAYLVEGLAHCGACHTPRGIAFQEKSLSADSNNHFLAGAVLEGWYAKSLRSEATGLASWTEEELFDFFTTGRNARTAAFGSMADVIAHSTQHMTAEDRWAMVKYLKQLPPKAGHSVELAKQTDRTGEKLLTADYTETGALEYVEHCAACHRLDGLGAARIFPALDNNSIVFAEDPSSLIQVTLEGGRMPSTKHDRMAFAMPGFQHLSDQEVADVLTFIRQGWSNNASKVEVKDVAKMRDFVKIRPSHYVLGSEK